MDVAGQASAAWACSFASLCGCGMTGSVLEINTSFYPRGMSAFGYNLVAGVAKQDQKRIKKGRVELHSTLTWAWQDFRAVSRSLSRFLTFDSRKRFGSPYVVCEIAGQYEDTFDDVDEHLLDYFTYKAVKTILAQLREMNPDQYTWFRDFVIKNKPQDGKLFLRLLVKESQELGEGVMVTRLHLFNRWVKRYKHDNVKKAMSDQNLELLRERLLQTIKMPSDGEDHESPATNA